MDILVAEGMLTAREVAERLRVSPRTVRRWAAAGRLQAVRLGSGPRRPYRVPASALERFARPAGPWAGRW